MEQKTTRGVLKCLVCGIYLGKIEDVHAVFEETSTLPFSQERISGKLNDILGTSFNSNNVTSDVICRKCYKLLEALDGLEWTLQEYKSEIKEKCTSCQVDMCISENCTIETEDFLPLIAFIDGDKEDNVYNTILDLDLDTGNSSLAAIDQEGVKENACKLKETVKTNLVEIEKSFCCRICHKQFVQECHLTDHFICSHMNKKNYKCEACEKSFTYRRELMMHVMEHESDVNPKFECNLCGKRYQMRRSFLNHRRRSHQSKIHSCKFCEKKFPSSEELNEHMNVHTGMRPYVCQVCAKSFANRWSLRNHVKIHQERDRPYQCNFCGKRFLKVCYLEAHMNTHNEAQFSCNICGKKFKTEISMKSHAAVHSTERPFVCHTCGKSFARKSYLCLHEQIHSGLRPYACDICGKTFSQNNNLRSHKKLTHQQECGFHCPHCNKAYQRRRLLDYHIMTAHTGEKPFVCQICGTRFVYPEYFKKHTHSGEKQYACRSCGRTFVDKQNRNMHEFVHTDIKPYQCAICRMGFTRKPWLLNHMSSEHPTEPVEGHVVRNILTSEYFKDVENFEHEVSKVKQTTNSHQLSQQENINGQSHVDQSVLMESSLQNVDCNALLQKNASTDCHQMLLSGDNVFTSDVEQQQMAVHQHLPEEPHYVQEEFPLGSTFLDILEYGENVP